MKRTIVAAMIGMAGMGCVTPSQPGAPDGGATGIRVEAGKVFDIAVGQEAYVQGTPIVVRFRGASDDSRCPLDVQCVWAGNAVIQLGLRQGKGAEADARVNTTLAPKSASVGAYSVRLIGLKPVPRAGKPIAVGDYIATLEVTGG